MEAILQLVSKKDATVNSQHWKPITHFRKIRDHSKLIEFETKVVDSGYKAKLLEFIDLKFQNMEKYSKSYRRFAYDIIDTFSSRQLYKEFSWMGKKTRDGKINHPFQDNIVFINFIFGVIQNKMPKFKFSELEDIFTVLCRNKKTHRNSDDEYLTESVDYDQE